MNKNFALTPLIAIFLLFGTTAKGQAVGDCHFLKGKFLELGIAPTGAFGSTLPAPAGFHPGAGNFLWDPGSSTSSTAGQIGFIADPDMNGWAVGSPAKFGDFFVPGTPQEGWSIQVAGTQSDAWLQNLSFGGTGYTGTLSGTNVSWNQSGSVITAVWQGQTSDPLQITQTTRFDTNKLYFTVNVKIKNIGSTVANNVYYLRTVDPDNEEEQSGLFQTINNITFQLPNPQNKVLVTAKGTTYAQAFLGLGTKDCRAKCFILDAGLTPFDNLAACYSESTTYTYSVGSTVTDDVGVGLVYNLGNIAVGDSAILTYAYIMRNADLDSALDATAPTVSAGASLLTPGSDTINACSSTSDTIHLNISNGGTYTWTWAPATGLATTTGTTNTLILSAVSGTLTYTLVGVPLGGACGNDTFHFTVTPGISVGPTPTNPTYCQYATASPLSAVGTNLLWYTAPSGGTGSSVPPTPITTTPGTYTWWVTQHVGLCTESVRVPVVVTVNPQPVVSASSNSPVCQYSTISLFAIDTVLMTHTYAWSGPAGYSSTMRNPTRSNAQPTMSGVYTVTLTENGCTATATTTVIVKPTPTISSTSMTLPSACNVSDGAITLQGLNADSVYTVSYTRNGVVTTLSLTADALGNVTITGLHAGTYTNIFVVGANGCPSNIVSVVLPDGAGPVAPSLSSNGPVCSDSTLYLFATSSETGVTYNWSGPGGFSSTLQNPVRTGVSVSGGGTYYCSITINATGCVSPAGVLSVVVLPTPSVPAVSSNSPVCSGTTLNMTATSNPAGASFSWVGPDGFTAAGPAAVSVSPATAASAGVYTVVATLNGCPSLPGYFTAVINPIPPAPLPDDVTYCQFDNAIPLTASGYNLLWYASMTGGTGAASAPTPSTDIYGTVTYYVSQTVLGCESPRAPLAVTTKVKPVVVISATGGSVCQADTATFTSTGPAYPGATYHWSFPIGGSIAFGNDSTAGPVGVIFDSTYTRAVSLTVTYNGCTTTNVQNIYVVPTPTLGVAVPENICVGDTATLALSSTTYHPVVSNYSWNIPGGTIISAGSGGGGPYSVAWYTPGVYVVNVTGYTQQSNCPSRSMNDTVHVHALPNATFSAGSVACNGDTMTLVATVNDPTYTYHWAPAPFFAGLGAVNAPVAIAEIMFPGYISLTVTDPFGCSATDSMLFNPLPCCLITFPTAFTPNGDGFNDRFRPITAGHHVLSLFRIVNRWGTTVYETTTTDTDGWDGTYGGEPQDMDTYYYVIRYTCDGHTTEESGSVTLIR